MAIDQTSPDEEVSVSFRMCVFISTVMGSTKRTITVHARKGQSNQNKQFL
jgi:hypothetical protein